MLEKASRTVPIKREDKKTGIVMILVEIRTISVMRRERKEKEIGMMILAKICFKGEIGRYLTTINAFPSLVMDIEAEALMTPENNKMSVRLIPDTSSGK